jgi:peptidoglycan/LPS O-acetylase OafA/YrhL
MIICAKCGAEAAGGPTCPRCGASLPADRSAKSLALASGILGAACGLAASVELIVDYSRNGSFGWSLISLASSVLCWLLIGFPMLSYRKIGLFLPVMGAATLTYLWVLNRLTGASDWFFPLALPIALAAMASGALASLLCLKARRRGPNVASFILLGCTIACLCVEGILSLRFQGFLSLTWSAIVAAVALPVAILLLGIQHRLRQPDAQPSLANSSSK